MITALGGAAIGLFVGMYLGATRNSLDAAGMKARIVAEARRQDGLCDDDAEVLRDFADRIEKDMFR